MFRLSLFYATVNEYVTRKLLHSEILAHISTQPAGLEFQAGWRGSHPEFLNPVEKKNCEDGRLLPRKILIFYKFLLFWNETSSFPKNSSISVQKLDNLLSVVISFCRSEVIVFWFNKNWMQFDQKIRNLVMKYHLFYWFSAK